MSRACWLALCLPLIVVSCEGLADPSVPEPPRESQTMPAHTGGATEPAVAMRCRIYFGCVALVITSDAR